MDLSDRQLGILSRVQANGRVSVEDLAAQFGVTTQTVRRDLNLLSDSGQLTRVHGGAVLSTRVSNLDYSQRRTVGSDAKKQIGAAVARMIPDHCSLLINIGTTTEQVAASLRDKQDLVVVTNNINVVTILAGSPDKELILAGGTVRQADGAVVGEAAVEFIRRFKVDFAVIGASALDADGSIMDYDMREVAVTRAIIENARETILACDASKFDHHAPVRICDIEKISTIVTDQAPPQQFRDVCHRDGVRLEIARGMTRDRGGDD